MRRLRSGATFVLALASAVCSAGCTPGSFAANAPAGTSSGGGPARIVTIDVNLTNDPNGYAPQVAMLAVGDGVRFVNSDGFAHTATSIAGTTFPSAYPFDDSALRAHGNALSAGFSSGSLAAGTASQTFVADRAGTYLFGCFYHYGSPMRATLVVR